MTEEWFLAALFLNYPETAAVVLLYKLVPLYSFTVKEWESGDFESFFVWRVVMSRDWNDLSS
jgi:hypothetical protein